MENKKMIVKLQSVPVFFEKYAGYMPTQSRGESGFSLPKTIFVKKSEFPKDIECVEIESSNNRYSDLTETYASTKTEFSVRPFDDIHLELVASKTTLLVPEESQDFEIVKKKKGE